MKVFFGGIVSKASGKFVNMVFSVWRGLPVVREFVAPSQPNSPRQLAVRTIFTEISHYWANTLTEGLRKAWDNFVFRWTDLWGDEISLTGLNLFQKFNFILRDNGRDFQTTTPPPITPSEISHFEDEGEWLNGSPTTIINPIATSEINGQNPFIDLWIAGDFSSVTVDDTSPNGTSITIWGHNGMPQGVNPVKSDFRHCIYIKELAQHDDPTKSKIISISADEFELYPRRFAKILRRYNKHGNYSAAVKSSRICYAPV